MTDLLVGQPVLISIDHQMAGYNDSYAVPQMGGYAERVENAIALVGAAREAGIPVIFVQERHARTLASSRSPVRRQRPASACSTDY
jgi:nicotinamidase-related amidase